MATAESIRLKSRQEVQAAGRVVGAWLAGSWTAHEGGVLALAAGPGEETVISAGADGMLRHWRLSDGRCLHTFAGHADAVTCVCLSPDGQSILSGSADGTLCLWSLAHGRWVRTLASVAADHGPVTAVGFTPCGRHALSRGVDSRLHLWDVGGGRWLGVRARRRDGLTRWLAGAVPPPSLAAVRGGYRRPLALSADARLVLLADQQAGRLELRELATGRRLWTFEGHEEWAHAAALTGDGRAILSAGADRLLKCWDTATGRCRLVYAGHGDEVCALSLSRDDRHLLSGSWDRTARLWDVADGRCLWTFRGHRDWVQAVYLAGDCSFALTADAGGTLCHWRLSWETGEQAAARTLTLRITGHLQLLA